jgi:hypothetical protein
VLGSIVAELWSHLDVPIQQINVVCGVEFSGVRCCVNVLAQSADVLELSYVV